MIHIGEAPLNMEGLCKAYRVIGKICNAFSGGHDPAGLDQFLGNVPQVIFYHTVKGLIGNSHNKLAPVPLPHIDQRLNHFICNGNEFRRRCVGMLILYEVRHLLIEGNGGNAIPHFLQLGHHLLMKTHAP